MNLEKDEQGGRLKDWELRTIEALAQEALNKTSAQEEIRNEDLWLSAAIQSRQKDACTKSGYRQQLARHAERLGIGNRHPARVTADDPLEYEVASDETSGRWQRIITLVLTVPKEHPWRLLHRELITEPLLSHRHDHEDWGYPNEGFDALDALEACAIEHGLIDANAPTPTAGYGANRAFLARLTSTVAGVPVTPPPAAAPPAQDDLVARLRKAMGEAA